MTKLTPSHSDLLAAIARADEGAIDAPQGAKGAIGALIKRGLLVSIPQAQGPSRLMITSAGRAAITGDKPLSPAKQAGAPTPGGKIAALLVLLRQPQGATVEAMMVATGWQAHSVRGALSGAIKKKQGLAVTSEKTQAGRVYRVVAGAPT